MKTSGTWLTIARSEKRQSIQEGPDARRQREKPSEGSPSTSGHLWENNGERKGSKWWKNSLPVAWGGVCVGESGLKWIWASRTKSAESKSSEYDLSYSEGSSRQWKSRHIPEKGHESMWGPCSLWWMRTLLTSLRSTPPRAERHGVWPMKQFLRSDFPTKVHHKSKDGKQKEQPVVLDWWTFSFTRL